MNVFTRIANFFKGNPPVVEQTVETILADFHKKLDELVAHTDAQLVKADQKAREAQDALAAKARAEAEAARAKLVHGKLAELLGVNN
jgi:hypothetical protein